jgi:hypothetical protein
MTVTKVTIDPIFRNSTYPNDLNPLDSAAPMIIILLAAPRIVRFQAIVLAAASIIHSYTSSPAKPLFIITKLYNTTNGTLPNN